jgi:serine/threonine-protein kinase
VGPASDLYTLGGTLFYALTGRPPYQKPGRDVAAMIHAHTREPVPRAREFNPAVPAAVDRLVGRMLAKDPADRGTPAELIAAFRKLLGPEWGEAPESEPAAAPPPPRAAAPARPTADDDSSPNLPVVGTALGAVERVFLPTHLRPLPGEEPPAGERVVALLRRPLVLIALATLLALLVLLFR